MDSGEYSSSITQADVSWLDLSKSGYAKVIFSDLLQKADSSVGCQFQITDNVDEHPCDCIGLFKVGYESLDQCIASKMLSEIAHGHDAKFLHCIFKSDELPSLENGFYQFLYITKDKEVCGASLAFEIKTHKQTPVAEESDSDSTEEDFLVVGSTLAEQNKELVSQIEKINVARAVTEKEFMCRIQKLEAEEWQLRSELRLALSEKERLTAECKKALEEKNALCRANDDKILKLEEQIKAITLNVENTCRAFKQLEQEKLALEEEKKQMMENQVAAESALCSLSKKYKVAYGNQDKLQKELKAKEEMLDSDHASLASQLENANQVIEALEESKKLANEEVTMLSEKNKKLQDNCEHLRNGNMFLEGKLKDAHAKLAEHEKISAELNRKIKALELKLKNAVEVNQKPKDVGESSKQAVPDLAVKPKSSKHSNDAIKCQILALELQLKDSKLTIEKLKSKIKQLQKKNIAASGNIKDTRTDKILNTSHCCESNTVIAGYEELQRVVSEKIKEIDKLKEECIKKDAVVEFLSKDKNELQKNSSLVAEALTDSVAKLQEAADIYKKQYVEIEKLKKKLKKVKSGRKSISSESSLQDASLASENAGEVRPENRPQQTSSDSDTGEHVMGQYLDKYQHQMAAASALIDKSIQMSVQSISSQRGLYEGIERSRNEKFKDFFGQSLDVTYLAVASAPEEPCVRSRESPELQSMVARNLAELSLSNASTDDQYSLPCPICNSEIGVNTASSDDMIKHLEVQHQQQMCPVCSKLFDMTLPSKYFQYHVEDHFMQDK